MNLKISLPFEILVNEENVTRIIAETKDGSFGILPHRLDCVAALVPGILIYDVESKDETYVAIDDGILIKKGANVIVSIRRGYKGKDLGKMKQEVEKEFMNLDVKEKDTQTILAKMESGFIHRLAEFNRG